MLKKLLLTLIAWGTGVPFAARGRVMTYDSRTAFTYRMPAGFAGDVNRTHPTDIEANLQTADATKVANLFGQAVLIDTADANRGVRRLAAGDQANAVVLTPYGFTVRPFPFQQSTATLADAQANFGAGTPPASGVIDIMRSGLIMAALNDPAETPKKGDPVYVWCAASAGNQVQGGLTTTYSAGSTVQLDPARYTFNGTADEFGVVEIAANV